MDQRDYMNIYGPDLESLPEIEFDLNMMTATFVDEDPDFPATSIPFREMNQEMLRDLRPKIEKFLFETGAECEKVNLGRLQPDGPPYGYYVEGWLIHEDTLTKIITKMGEGALYWLGSLPKTHTVALKWQVCGTCHGKGKHVNPSIDAHGLSYEDMHDDPEFAEEYLRGMYDVPCYECKGRTTTLTVDEKGTSQETLKFITDWIDDMYAARRECYAERRMGF